MGKLRQSLPGTEEERVRLRDPFPGSADGVSLEMELTIKPQPCLLILYPP